MGNLLLIDLTDNVGFGKYTPNEWGRIMKAPEYCRVSSQGQIERTSLKAQEDQIRAYCTMKGTELTGVLVDAGVFCGKPLADRPAGSRVVDMRSARGGFDHHLSAGPRV